VQEDFCSEQKTAQYQIQWVARPPTAFYNRTRIGVQRKKQTRLMALKPDYPGESAPEMYIEGFRETNEYVSQLRN